MTEYNQNVYLITAYQQALRDYDAAKDGRGNRVTTFISFLVAERVLMSQCRLPQD